MKGNLECAIVPKGVEIKMRPNRKAKKLPICLCSPFVERTTSMLTDYSKEEGLLANYVFSHSKILSQRSWEEFEFKNL